MSQVIYNNTEIFPVPFVTHAVQPFFRGDGRRLGYLERYTLQGLLTGCRMDVVTGYLSTVLNVFSKDFGTLQFIDTNFTGVVSGIKINSVNVENSSLIGVVGYTVELDAYPENFYESNGIVEKKNEWQTTLSQNGELATSHNIFAKGKNTAPSYDNALDNARNFALLYTGLPQPSLFPFFISGFSGKLDSRVENINRLDGSIQINETYVASTGLPVVKTLSFNVDSGTDGIISVGVRGGFRAGKGVSFDNARQAYSGFDSFAEASGVYQSYRGVTGLMILPLSSGIIEDQATNNLEFDILFNDFPTVRYRHIFTTQVVSGTDNIITASVNGRIEGLGRQNIRYDNAYNFFTGLNILSEIQQAFTDYVGVGFPYPLNPFPTDSGNTLDRFNGVIDYNVTLNNKTPVIQCSGIKFFDVTYNKQYAMRQVSPVSIPNSVSGLDTLDLDWNTRGTIEVQGSVTMDKPFTSIDATGAVRQFINGKFRREILASGNKTKLRLEVVNLNQSVNIDTCSFTVTYTFDEPLANDPTTSYILITGLQI